MKSVVLVAAAAYLAFLVSQLPASLVYDATSRFMPDLKMEQPEGTFWEGSSSRLRVSGVELGSVQWEARPLAFLLGEWSNAVRLDGRFPGSANLGIGLGESYTLSDARFQLDLADLVSMSRGLSTLGVKLGGDVSASLDHADIEGQKLEAIHGLLTLRSLTLPDGKDIGDFTGQLNTDDDGAHRLDFRSVNDEKLQVEGRLVLLPDDSMELDLLIRNPEFLGRTLGSMFRNYAREESDGFRYLWQGSTRMLGLIL